MTYKNLARVKKVKVSKFSAQGKKKREVKKGPLCSFFYYFCTMASALRNICRQHSRFAVRSFSSSATRSSSHGLLRLKEYYDHTLSEDLMVLGYDHARVAPPTSRYPDIEAQIKRALEDTPVVQTSNDKENPDATRSRKGGKPVRPIQPLKSAKVIPSLDKITLHAMVKESIHSKSNLLSAFMAFQSITGIRPDVVYARTSVANWKLR